MPEPRDGSEDNDQMQGDPLWEEFARIADRRNDSTDQELLDEIMFSVSSDEFGLWELAGSDSADGEWAHRVRGLAHELVQRGWVDVWERPVMYLPGNEAEYGPHVRLDEAPALDVVSNELHWDYERIQDAPVRYFLRVTEFGKREWRDDGRRRGLFRNA
jgi:hypothetical protein